MNEAAAIARNISDLAKTCQHHASTAQHVSQLESSCLQWCNLGIALENRRLTGAINMFLAAKSSRQHLGHSLNCLIDATRST